MQYFLYILTLCFGISISTHNPYRRNVELLLQEPSSGPYTKDDAAAVQELWIAQKVDHFDVGNNATWQMVSKAWYYNNIFQPFPYLLTEIPAKCQIPQATWTNLHIRGW